MKKSDFRCTWQRITTSVLISLKSYGLMGVCGGVVAIKSLENRDPISSELWTNCIEMLRKFTSTWAILLFCGFPPWSCGNFTSKNFGKIGKILKSFLIYFYLIWQIYFLLSFLIIKMIQKVILYFVYFYSKNQSMLNLNLTNYIFRIIDLEFKVLFFIYHIIYHIIIIYILYIYQ